MLMDQHKGMLITNIQRMCMNDGPGIRTTVFFKGCNLHCPWCSNPENISFLPETFTDTNESGVYGRYYSEKELLDEITRDIPFYKTGGGVTFSGGEPLLHLVHAIPLLKELKARQIHIVAETALMVNAESVVLLEPYIDAFIVDCKVMDETAVKTVLGGDVSLYQQNVRYLYEKNKIHLFRIPCCKEISFYPKNKESIAEFLGQYNQIPVEIFSVHNLGEQKYQSLNRKVPYFEPIEKEKLQEFCDALALQNVNATVIEI